MNVQRSPLEACSPEANAGRISACMHQGLRLGTIDEKEYQRRLVKFVRASLRPLKIRINPDARAVACIDARQFCYHPAIRGKNRDDLPQGRR